MNIKRAPIRTDVQARFSDELAFNGPVGSSVEAFIKVAQPEVRGRVVAALVNGRLRELSQPLTVDSEIHPVTTADSDGSRIFRRSLSFLVIAAASELFPTLSVSINHSMPFGGYYCECVDADGAVVTLDSADLARLKALMQRLVDADLPITPVRTPLDEALPLFRALGDAEKAELFAKRRKDYLMLYELNGIRDYFHGFMVPRTSYLEPFDIHPYSTGFIFQFPRRTAPHSLQPFEDEPRLAQVFQSYSDWLRVIDVPSVAALNRAIAAGRSQEIMLVAEALHERHITQIAATIAEGQPDLKLVLISGPTSAGKTTFSKRLAVQLLARGIEPVAVPMDNYFVDRDSTPRDAQGEYDFEALEAVDVPLFRKHLSQLLAGGTIVAPHYNFHTGQREWAGELAIKQDQVILVEGIHGLNPQLVAGLDAGQLYRIFISAFTQLNLDRHNRVPTTDTRKLRRLVRDAARRGYTATDTLARWPSVRRGEKRHIFPYQVKANTFFNSALVYELAILKPLVQPLLLQVEPDAPERVEANRLLAFLQWFDPISARDADLIPNDSILREFIGGSSLEAFEPWRR